MVRMNKIIQISSRIKVTSRSIFSFFVLTLNLFLNGTYDQFLLKITAICFNYHVNFLDILAISEDLDFLPTEKAAAGVVGKSRG